MTDDRCYDPSSQLTVRDMRNDGRAEYSAPEPTWQFMPEIHGDLRYAEFPLLWADGEHDDTAALQAVILGQPARCAWCMQVIAPGGRAITASCSCRDS